MSQKSVIFLEVLSVDNKVVTADTRSFVVARMSGLKANGNKAITVTITEAGDGNNVLSEWAVNTGIGNFVYDGLRLYWKFASNGNVRTIALYSSTHPDSLIATGSATIVDGANAVIYFSGVKDYTLNGSVKATIGGGDATDDIDNANTLTFTNVTKSRGLAVPGEAQFMYQEGVERMVKYTVTETVAAIEAEIAGS